MKTLTKEERIEILYSLLFVESKEKQNHKGKGKDSFQKLDNQTRQMLWIKASGAG